MSQVYSLEEVQKHNKAGDAWIVIDDGVYDVSKFMDFHPGSRVLLVKVAGTDCTDEFYALHRQEVLKKYERLKIGTVQGKKPVDHDVAIPFLDWKWEREAYLKPSHYAFEKAVYEIVDKEFRPHADEMDATGKIPDEIYRKLGEYGFLTCVLGPGPLMKKFGKVLPGGVKPEEYDYFHAVIFNEAFKSLGSWGLVDGLLGGISIGLPPIVKFGSPQMIERVVPQILTGEKRICLAITDPYAGSDVAGTTCEAKLSSDGSHYIVNGVKKWITGGMTADYFTTAVRTGGPGHGGVSFLLIERSEGVETKAIKTSYTPAAGTSFVSFENVKVPVANRLGKENKGFPLIMANFVLERWTMAVGGNKLNRMVIEECVKWAYHRRAFGKPLIALPQIQERLAEMIAYTNSVQAYIDLVTDRMNKLSFQEINQQLAGTISLLKNQQVEASRVVSDGAVQIFGGRSLTEGGLAKYTSKFQKNFQFGAVLGGASSVLSTQALRHELRTFPKQSRL